MTHRANGVADFVGDTRTQAAKRSELGLLHARVHQTGVFEKDEYRAIAIPVFA